MSKLASFSSQEHQFILAADELVSWYALDKCDWTEVENGLPGNIHLLLTFNPGQTTKPIKLPVSDAFHHVESELQYRNSISVLKLYRCISEHKTGKKPVTPPGKAATDVKGELPLLLDLGYNKDPEVLRRALVAARDFLGEQVTVVPFKPLLSPKSQTLVHQTTSQWSSWRVERGEIDGWEWDKVVMIGGGGLEAISRARMMLVVIRVCQVDTGKWLYDLFTPAFHEAQKAGLLKIAAV